MSRALKKLRFRLKCCDSGVKPIKRGFFGAYARKQSKLRLHDERQTCPRNGCIVPASVHGILIFSVLLQSGRARF